MCSVITIRGRSHPHRQFRIPPSDPRPPAAYGSCRARSACTLSAMEPATTTQAVQRFLDELAEGDGVPDEAVVRALLARSADRLELLCSRYLHRSYPRLTQGPAYLDAGDLLGAVVERLLKALRDVRPQSVRQFFGLANRHIRWELNDLARRVDKQQTIALNTLDPVAPCAQTTQAESHTLRRILAAIDELPADEREVFELVRVQGMSHLEAGELLCVSQKTVQRRLRRGVLLLAEALRDLQPDPAAANGGTSVSPPGTLDPPASSAHA